MFLLPRTVTDHGNFYVSLLSGTVNEDVNFRAVFFFLNQETSAGKHRN